MNRDPNVLPVHSKVDHVKGEKESSSQRSKQNCKRIASESECFLSIALLLFHIEVYCRLAFQKKVSVFKCWKALVCLTMELVEKVKMKVKERERRVVEL